tara:strand:- start:139 stop:2367 length:2229 start_codon:yes stop_codon:yes gene_type:complete
MLSPYVVTVYTKQDNPYNVIPDAPIEVRERLANGTSGSLSIIYEDQEGLIPITQTGAKADSNGQFVFYAEAAQYNAVYESQTVPVDIGLTADSLPSALSNSLSQAYEFETIIDMTSSVIEFPDGKALNIKDENGKFSKYVKVSTPSDEVLAGGGWAKKVSDIDLRDTTRERNLNPLFIEQFLTGFGGRGQLDSEPDNLVSEQAIVGTFSAGVDLITVTTPSNFQLGGHISVLHDNGRYWTYFINGITGSNVTISPKLKWDVTNTTCERGHYNKAHPGKYYMRQLAQRAVYELEYNASVPEKRLMMSQLDTSPNEEIDTLTGVGGGSVSYFDANNVGGGGIGSNLRFNIGRTALVSCSTVGDGAKSFSFQNNGAGTVNLRLALSTGNSNTGVRIRVYNDADFEIFNYDIASTESLGTPTIYNLPIMLQGKSKTFYVEITAFDLPTAGNIYIDQLEVYELTASNSSIFDGSEDKTLVALGDSWIAGDLGSTAEREPITQQLAIELPFMNIINKGVGGDTATQLLARFDADVTPNNPDYVLINVGTNDCTSPPSGTFFPTAVEAFSAQITELIGKCQAIGAKPILYGVPAFAESFGAFVDYELNDRARLYSQYVYKNFGRLVQSNSVGEVSYDSTAGNPTGAVISSEDTGSGTVTKWADGTMIIRRNIDIDMTADAAINFPEAFAVGTIPDCSMTVVTISSVTTTTAMKDAFMQCTNNAQWSIRFPTVGTVTDENFNLMAVGRWF